MSEDTEILREIRDLLRLMAEPALAKRDERLRTLLQQIIGKSKQKAEAVVLMDATRSQATIRKDCGIDHGNLSRLVKALRDAELIRHPPDDRLFGARLTPGAGIGKPEPRRERPDRPEGGKIGAARGGSSDIVLAKAHLSRCSRWNSCRRPVHAGAGGGCGRSSAISHRISANSILGMATSAIWKAT